MVSLVKCPSCDKRYRIEDDSLGKQAKCKGCGETFTLVVSADETAGGQAASLLHGMLPSGAEEQLPEKLGRFAIRQQLGAGSFGAVYKAFDPVLQREVATPLDKLRV